VFHQIKYSPRSFRLIMNFLIFLRQHFEQEDAERNWLKNTGIMTCEKNWIVINDLSKF